MKESVELDEKKLLSFEILSETHCCINAIEDNVDLMRDFLVFWKEKKDLYLSSLGKNVTTVLRRNRKDLSHFSAPNRLKLMFFPLLKLRQKAGLN